VENGTGQGQVQFRQALPSPNKSDLSQTCPVFPGRRWGHGDGARVSAVVRPSPRTWQTVVFSAFCSRKATPPRPGKWAKPRRGRGWGADDTTGQRSGTPSSNGA
jgi:hypothetical protein